MEHKYIDADALHEKMQLVANKKVKTINEYAGGYWAGITFAKWMLEEMPAADVELARKWISVDERLPVCEVEVLILTKSGITTAIYEDGTMPTEESKWNWIDMNFDYNEKTDEYFIPEGWFEERHYNPDEVYNNIVDEKVIVWMPLPESPKMDGGGEKR